MNKYERYMEMKRANLPDVSDLQMEYAEVASELGISAEFRSKVKGRSFHVSSAETSILPKDIAHWVELRSPDMQELQSNELVILQDIQKPKL